MRGIFTIIVIVLVVLLVLFVVRRRTISTKGPRPPKGPIARVEVHEDGTVTFDGTDISLDELRVRLKKLKEADGAVWYYRDSSDKDAEETGEAVIKVVIEARIPVRLMDEQTHR
ncbi:MAG TPA: hypothetical protein VMU92_01115 [Acidobacteriaceae bacterium]|nr:hypothetical protein [Acidobacteriaceae bacterium]